MTVGNWITAVGIAAGAIVALVVGYLHRKQMRQLEEYRRDPKVGLKPPPHPLVTFLRRYGWTIWLGFSGICLLGFEHFNAGQPVTRDTIWNIVDGVIFLFFAALSYFLGRLSDFFEKIRKP